MKTFTVLELIEELNSYPDYVKVIVNDGCGETREAYYTELTDEGVRIG